ncbi:CU044_5270 family protein [Nonomuraea sp. NPDC050556]|uniref:CU044_5270 family protein n=1 Tax=Nonomuraea sp. NPDC050556 TaxID=3364369 RepID=UPI0037AA8FD5
MNQIRQFRSSTPVITREAEEAARTRLLNAMHEPTAAPRRRAPRLAWRLALAASVAVAVGTGLIVIRGVDRTAYVPVASVQDLGELAARAVEDDPVPAPGQWLYVKETLTPFSNEPSTYGAKLDERETLETWTSADGKQVAMDDGEGKLIIEPLPEGLSSADLGQAPVTPEEMLARVDAAVTKTPRIPADQPGSNVDTPKDQLIFEAVRQLMSSQPLAPEVRAALFRALPLIEGVSVKQGAVDAAGRHGVAFVRIGGDERVEIIVSDEDYRFLGFYVELSVDRTWGIKDGQFPGYLAKAGTPLVFGAQLDTRLVDKPGQLP